jgi:hypothetical protein
LHANFENDGKYSQYPAQYRGISCPAVGNTGVISLLYQPGFFFALVI